MSLVSRRNASTGLTCVSTAPLASRAHSTTATPASVRLARSATASSPASAAMAAPTHVICSPLTALTPFLNSRLIKPALE